MTPDSFSDGGCYLAPEKAVEHALLMIDHGADFIDVGGESTRPRGKAYGEGADAISPAEELERVLPVIEQLARESDIPISIDTTKAEVARQALHAGAVIVNDISGLTFDPMMPGVIGAAEASAVVMHIQGTPRTMQKSPAYADLFGEITSFLRESLATGARHGIKQIMIDPGIGFGKTVEHNLRILNDLGTLGTLGYPILVGPSRKSFIGQTLDLPVDDRLEGTIASSVAAVLHGAHVLRVHDVREVVRAARMTDAIMNASSQEFHGAI